VATIYLQLIQNRYMFQSFTVFQSSRDSSGGRPLHSNYQHNRRC